MKAGSPSVNWAMDGWCKSMRSFFSKVGVPLVHKSVEGSRWSSSRAFLTSCISLVGDEPCSRSLWLCVSSEGVSEGTAVDAEIKKMKNQNKFNIKRAFSLYLLEIVTIFDDEVISILDIVR